MRNFLCLKRERVLCRASHPRPVLVLLIILFSLAPTAAPAAAEKIIFFAADGLRQDLVRSYAAKRAMPNFSRLLRFGARAGQDGLLTVVLRAHNPPGQMFAGDEPTFAVNGVAIGIMCRLTKYSNGTVEFVQSQHAIVRDV